MGSIGLWRLLTVALLTWSVSAFAHQDGPANASNLAPGPFATAVTSLAGRVTSIVVENRVAGTTSHHLVLVTDDGRRLAFAGAGARNVPHGAAVLVEGKIDGRLIFPVSLRVNPSPKATSGRRDGSATSTLEGILRLGHADNFDGTPSEFFYALETADGQMLQVTLAAQTGVLKNGMHATIRGEVTEGSNLFPERIIITSPGTTTSKKLDTTAAASTANYIVIPVKFPTNATPPYTYAADPFTTATLNTAVFGVAPASSVAEYYKEVSFGKQLLAGVVAVNGTGGWLLSAVPPPATCDTAAIAAAAETAATARGYNLGSYTGRVYVFSNNVPGCSWSGLAYVSYARSWIKQTSSLLVIGHELGHNFGMYHSASLDCGATSVLGGTCNASEYGDPFDIMGNNRAMHVASTQKDDLGWLPPGSVDTHTMGTRTYTLSPIEVGGGTKYAVKVPAATNRTYWIEYRQPIGFDSALASYPNNGAQIRVASPFEFSCSCNLDTQFLDFTPATTPFTDGALVTGKTYTDTLYNIDISVLSTAAGASGSMTVKVTMPGGPPAASTQINSSLNPAAASTSIAFTAAVTGNAPAGTVAFTDSGVTIPGCSAVALTGSGSTRSAVCTTAALAPGARVITAIYSGDINNSSASSSAYGQSISAGTWLGFLYGMNQAVGSTSAVTAGTSNLASGQGSFVGAGTANQANGISSLVIGGFDNRATGIDSLVGAGAGNRATGARAVIVGGGYNLGGGNFSFIGGGGRDGVVNTAAGTDSKDHIAAGKWSTIGGGVGNLAGSSAVQLGSTVAGGQFNQAVSTDATVGGGNGNVASGVASTIPGGASNSASGDYSSAFGRRAKAVHTGAISIGDGSNFDFASTLANQFSVRAVGGTRIVSAIDGAGTATAGVTLAAGSGTWASLSDQAAKQDLAVVDPQTILAKVVAMPVSTWRYRSETSGALHMGPTAQDFHAAFGLGEGNRTITTVDADGVALAAIQGLHQVLEARNAQSLELSRDMDVLTTRLEALETVHADVAQIKAQMTQLLQRRNPEIIQAAVR